MTDETRKGLERTKLGVQPVKLDVCPKPELVGLGEGKAEGDPRVVGREREVPDAEGGVDERGPRGGGELGGAEKSIEGRRDCGPKHACITRRGGGAQKCANRKKMVARDRLAHWAGERARLEAPDASQGVV